MGNKSPLIKKQNSCVLPELTNGNRCYKDSSKKYLSGLNNLCCCNKILPFFLISVFLFSETEAQDSWRGPAHFAISAAGSFLLAETPTLFTDDYRVSNTYLFSSTVMIMAGFFKEGIDVFDGKQFSWEDIGVDCIGISAGLLSHYLLLERKRKRVSPVLRINRHGIELSARILM